MTPVPLVLDLRITHDRYGSSSDPNLNGNLHYPNEIDRSLNEAAADKIRKYRVDYNNNSPNTISFMSDIDTTSGRLHGEFVRLLFLQSHRETDRFLHPQEFSLRNLPVEDSSTFAAWRSSRSLNQNVEIYSLRLQLYVLTLT